ncbi:MAG: hypothetical protein WAM94_10840 [Chromatiaceae bacterium]
MHDAIERASVGGHSRRSNRAFPEAGALLGHHYQADVHHERPEGGLPAIVAELAQINAKMHVITASMDSTMGRAGRMIPRVSFSP